jgi:16S rRNA G527 N7-methylase RsmG
VKKARFLRQVIIELDLCNVELVVENAKSYRPSELFDTVTARALAQPLVAWNTVRHLLRPGGHALLQSVSSMRNLRFSGGLVRRSANVEIVGVNRPSYVTEIERTQAGDGTVAASKEGR